MPDRAVIFFYESPPGNFPEIDRVYFASQKNNLAKTCVLKELQNRDTPGILRRRLFLVGIWFYFLKDRVTPNTCGEAKTSRRDEVCDIRNN